MKKALGIAALALILFAAIFGKSPSTSTPTPADIFKSSSSSSGPTAPAIELTEEQKAQAAAAKAKIEAENLQLARDVLAVRQLRQSMKNPDSFKLEEAVRMRDGTLCLSYRATNGFNAIVPGQSVITKDSIISSGGDRFPGAWQKSCAGKTGDDVKHIRFAL